MEEEEIKDEKVKEEENRQETKHEGEDDQRTGSVTRTMLMDPEREREPIQTREELKASEELRSLLFRLRLNPTREAENVRDEIEEICRGIEEREEEKRKDEEEQKKKGSNKLRKTEDPKG